MNDDTWWEIVIEKGIRILCNLHTLVTYYTLMYPEIYLQISKDISTSISRISTSIYFWTSIEIQNYILLPIFSNTFIRWKTLAKRENTNWSHYDIELWHFLSTSTSYIELYFINYNSILSFYRFPSIYYFFPLLFLILSFLLQNYTKFTI